MDICIIDIPFPLCYNESMVKKQQIETSHNQSSLERFQLGFEYNKTLQEIKREVRIRTI